MDIKLQAQIRELKEKLEKDQIPAVLYGAGIENKNLKLKRVELEKAFESAGESNLIELEIAGDKSVKVLVKETQYEPLKGTLQHIDFYQVDMTKKITTEIPLEFIGESKAVKELGGLLVKNVDAVEVECLPSDLVDHIVVDLSVLLALHDSIHLNQLNVPKGMELLGEAETVIATVVEPKEEKIEVAPAATPAATPAASKTDAPATDKK